ncbi:NUDIX hydrolase [Gordonia rhizosphera]|uniref:Putative hydrolase n=1 Tax=Gordonia rhizosphera NBRC 16068 TaxID=1108045 RepID=K6X334_9ACTN|nr:NUDIX hydrolase [Gordonia rhizosphera]GAB93209.1 putative hydrolase [Gordonia rhizosphera NBRC 16068]
MPDDLLSVVSVDVVALHYDAGRRQVFLGTHDRTTEPFLGQRALPGVVVHSGERLRDAAQRALGKLGITATPPALGQVRTFDEPSRDPRGPSLAIAMWAAFPDAPALHTPEALWEPVDAVGPLAFDHSVIVAEARDVLSDRLWRDVEFTRALTGPEFTATDAVAITRQLSGHPPHRANLNRDLARISGLTQTGDAPTSGARPPKLWRWEDPTDQPA